MRKEKRAFSSFDLEEEKLPASRKKFIGGAKKIQSGVFGSEDIFFLFSAFVRDSFLDI